MNRDEKREISVALDIGTSKVVALVAEVTESGDVEVIGMGRAAVDGLKKGVVINVESVVQSIKSAVKQAEEMSGCHIQSVITGISGSHVLSFNSDGMVPLYGREIEHADIEKVTEAAQAVLLPEGQRIIHVLPREFIVDGQGGIRDPIEINGVRLETNVHIVSAATTAIQNVVKCIERCGLSVRDVVLNQLASGYAVLSDDEKEMGVCVIDIGEGTTDIAVFSAGAMIHSHVVPVGGSQVTSDIALALRTSPSNAEQVKVKYACAVRHMVMPDDLIEVPGIGNRPAHRMERQMLSKVVEPRYEELLDLVYQNLKENGLGEKVAAGVVITGGGARMEGMVELAEEVFRLPVRLGLPQGAVGLKDVLRNPVHATGIGLLLYGKKVLSESGARDIGQLETVGSERPKGVLEGVKGWFNNHL